MGLTKEQLAFRRTGVGASEIAALMGISPYAGPIDVYEAKVHGVEKEETLKMFLGTRLEDPIAELYEQQTGKFLVRSGTLRHPKYPHVLATPDRIVFGGKVNKRKPPPLQEAERLAQFKATGWRMRAAWGLPGTDQIPDDYQLQVQQEMTVAGLGDVDVGVLFDREAFEIYPVRADPEIAGILCEEIERFWKDHVEARKPPPPDHSERYTKFLTRVFPQRDESLLPASPQVEAMVWLWSELEAAIDEKTQQLDKLKNELRAWIGEHAGVAGTFGKVTYKQNKDSVKVDWEAVALDAHTTTALLRDALLAEAENYRDGDEYQPHGLALREAAGLVRPLPELVQRFTTMKPGNRPLRRYDPPKGTK